MKKSIKMMLTLALTGCVGAALAGAAAGGESDPLISMSYLTEVNTPAILKEVDTRLESREQALQDKLSALVAQYEADMDAKLAAASGAGESETAASSVFSVVTLTAGQSLLGNVGCEFLLRSGSATCVAASAPGLIDSTGGLTLANGGAIEPNHLYLVTADGRGLQAAGDVTVMVRGSYAVS